MSRSDAAGSEKDDGLGGAFEVDGVAVEIDLAEWGWDRPSAAGDGRSTAESEGSEKSADSGAEKYPHHLAESHLI